MRVPIEYLYNNHKYGSINLSNSKGVTPLHLAVKNENHQILHYILEHPAFFTQCKNPVDSIGQSCLHLAAIVGNLEAYKLISSYSHQINPCDPNGSGITPLHNVMKHYESEAEGKVIHPKYYKHLIKGFQVNLTSVSLKCNSNIKAYLPISLDRIIVLVPSIPYFKSVGMRSLQN